MIILYISSPQKSWVNERKEQSRKKNKEKEIEAKKKEMEERKKLKRRKKVRHGHEPVFEVEKMFVSLVSLFCSLLSWKQKSSNTMILNTESNTMILNTELNTMMILF